MASNGRHTENLRQALANRRAIDRSRALTKSGKLRFANQSVKKTVGQPRGGR